MKVMIVGSGAREHALVHALRRSPSVDEIYAAPGNPGIGQMADLIPVPADDIAMLAEAASDLKIDLTVVGPELPLAMGIADEFASRGLRLFGPSRRAAEIESSKVFCKGLCTSYGIPTAHAQVANGKDETWKLAKQMGFPVVIKADGLAGGKGVTVVRNEQELEEALEVYFVERRFGDAAGRVLVEEYLEGREVSFMAICDGHRVMPLPSSRDYKRLGDGDTGPNTGGMGAHSPAHLSSDDYRLIAQEVVAKAIRAMRKENRPFVGVLYAGLMMTADGPKVLEFNCRFGDPEAQVVLLRLEEDMGELFVSASNGHLDAARPLKLRKEAAVCVVAASEGYPGRVEKGKEILGLSDAMAIPGVTVYHAGTAVVDGKLVTAGGRVLSVCGRGPSLSQAAAKAYAGIEKIHFDGMQYRRDIAVSEA